MADVPLDDNSLVCAMLLLGPLQLPRRMHSLLVLPTKKAQQCRHVDRSICQLGGWSTRNNMAHTSELSSNGTSAIARATCMVHHVGLGANGCDMRSTTKPM